MYVCGVCGVSVCVVVVFVCVVFVNMRVLFVWGVLWVWFVCVGCVLFVCVCGVCGCECACVVWYCV